MRWVIAFAFLMAAPAVSAQDYIGSDRCTACHQDAFEAWEGSHHALAWTPAEDTNILADFNDTRFAQGDFSVLFHRDENGNPRIEVTEKDGETTDYPVHSVVGIEPLQQYLLETEPGRLQSFDVVWDTEKGGWFHLYPDSDYAPDNGLHWSGPYKTWNSRCATCHATGYATNYDSGTQSFASTQVEIGVGCEACHGPGSDHVGWAETMETTQTPPENYGFTVDFSDAEEAIQQCAGCHSRREAFLDGNPMPGTDFDDAYNLATLRPGLYEADGQILDEVYVYGSFLQSKMYAKGVSCSNCHLPHEADLVAEGNAVCTQCHNPAGNPEFPTLVKADYDSPEHHRHEPGTPGAQCKNCHMVERVYMGNDWRADHSFRIPRPDLAETTGAPDACTTCHEGRNPEWAADQIAEWFPNSTHRGPHYGEILAHGRRDPAGTAQDLVTLSLNRAEPGLVRATALWLLAQNGEGGPADAVAATLDDPDPLVRAAAVRAQRMAPMTERSMRLIELLNDPSKSVRIAAFMELSSAQIAHLPDKYAKRMQSVAAEWRSSVGNRLDYPETHLQIAGLALVRRNLAAASGAFAAATWLDPQLVDAWSMRARIAAVQGQQREALNILDEAIARNPDSLGLQTMRSELLGQNDGSDLLPPAAD
ncbi:MAG: multiheme c-type cytochrome [Heliomarina sp.]|uniref:multiheme c-type cytochrome n=1 Tax=Heliomarina sp. TaxID=2917556 RepID=UPI004058FC41